MKRILLFLMPLAYANEVYTFSGNFSKADIYCYEQSLILKNAKNISCIGRPSSNELSYLTESTASDFMIKLNKDTYAKVESVEDGIQVTVDNKQDAQPIIMIDAGHGGNDPGAIAIDGTYEKDVVLSFSELLVNNLKKTLGEGVIALRTTDSTMGKYERLKQIIKIRPKYLLSIHADAYINSSVNGISSIYLDQSGGSEQSREILVDHVRDEENDQASKKFANALLSSLKGYKLHGRHAVASPLVILRSPYTISSLLEIGFLSNPSEAIKLQEHSYQEKLADDLSKGILGYLYTQEGIIAHT